MRFKIETYQQKLNKFKNWKATFAWYPILIINNKTETFVWLEFVLRKGYSDRNGFSWEYKLLDKEIKKEFNIQYV